MDRDQEDVWIGSLKGRRHLWDSAHNSPRINRQRYNSETETIFEERLNEARAERAERGEMSAMAEREEKAEEKEKEEESKDYEEIDIDESSETELEVEDEK